MPSFEDSDALRLIIEHAPAAIAVLDREMRYLAVSRLFAADLGRDGQDLVGQSHYAVFPDAPLRWREVYRRCLAGAVERCEEDVFPRADGSTDIVTWEVRPWHDAMGQVAGLLIFNAFVTAQVRTRTSLRESQELVRSIFEQSALGIAQIDPKTGQIARANEKMCEILRTPRSLLLARTWQEFSHPDDAAKAVDAIERVTAGREASVTIETRFCSGGEAGWLRANLTRMIFDDGHSALLATVEDITDRKRTLDALHEAEHRLATVFRVAQLPMAVIRWSDRRYVEVNAAFTELFGWTRQETLGKTPQDLNIFSESPTAGSLVRRLLDEGGGSLKAGEVRLRTRSGRIITCLVSVGFADMATERCAFGFFQDVTERRANQEALQRQQAELNAIFELAPIGMVQTDPQSSLMLRVNRQMCTITGYGADELLTMHAYELIHPDDRAEHDVNFGAVARGERPGYQHEKRLLCKGGRVCWIHVRVTALTDDSGRVQRALASLEDISERKAAERDLALHLSAFHAADNGIVITDTDGVVQHANAATSRLTGYDISEIVGSKLRLLRSGEQSSAFYQELWQTVLQGRVWRGELVNRRKDGSLYDEEQTITPVRDGAGAITHFIAIKQDISFRKRAEERQRDIEQQLRAVQKLEAVGRLAGGIAHDFNNLLSVILSYSEVAAAGLRSDDPLGEDLGEILRAAQRAEALTGQLLAFSRRQAWKPESIDLCALVQGIGKMLRRLIGEDIRLDVVAAPGLFRTRADAGQVEQVLMNLAVNARDAMPDGGRLTIAMANADLDDSAAAALDVQPGPYVELAVSDTGCGMDAGTLSRAFEPFFTTKGVGKGTGLGLSMVYGIVRQSGGGISAASTPGAGSVFRIVLRRDDTDPKTPRTFASGRALPGGGETILVVEDEGALREVMHRVLTGAGYTVLAAANAAQAITLCERRGSDLALVITDVIMPGMNGRTLAARVAGMCPAARVIFMSGYTDDTIERLDLMSDELLRKPFNGEMLLQKVRHVLGAPPLETRARAAN